MNIMDQAWTLMKEGRSLNQAARFLNVSAKELDRAMWVWRGVKTRSLKPH